MKQEFIEDLYYGRYNPFERPRASTPARDAIEQQIETETHYFTTVMRDDDYRRFLDLSDLYTASASFEQMDAFASGLQLGARFMHAILAEDETASQPRPRLQT